MNTTKVHGFPIIGFLKTEVQQGKECGYIIVEKEFEYVVGWYRDGDNEWSSGDYFRKAKGVIAAVDNMVSRAGRYL